MPRRGYHSLTFLEADQPVAITFDLGHPFPIDDVRLFPIQWVGFPHWIGFGFPVRFKVEGSLDPDFHEPTMLGDFTQSDVPNPGLNPVVVPTHEAVVRYVRLTATRLWERFTDHVVALSEIQIYSGGRNLAPQAQIAAPPPYPAKEWKPEFIIDGIASGHPILPLPEWIAQLQASSRLEEELAQLQHLRTVRRAAWGKIVEGSLAALTAGAFLLVAGLAWRSMRLRKKELTELRERISRDLHDEVGSNLAGIALLSREATQAGSEQQARLLEDIGRIAFETAGSMRDLVWMIQPGAPGDLVGAFRQCAERMLGRMQLRFHPSERPLPARLSLHFKRQLYLIFREALQNITKHSQAQKVEITLTQEGPWLTLTIQDDGVGFLPNSPSLDSGHGLDNMRQRAQRLDGSCEVQSHPDKGTTLCVRVRSTSR